MHAREEVVPYIANPGIISLDTLNKRLGLINIEIIAVLPNQTVWVAGEKEALPVVVAEAKAGDAEAKLEDEENEPEVEWGLQQCSLSFLNPIAGQYIPILTPRKTCAMKEVALGSNNYILYYDDHQNLVWIKPDNYPVLYIRDEQGKLVFCKMLEEHIDLHSIVAINEHTFAMKTGEHYGNQNRISIYEFNGKELKKTASIENLEDFKFIYLENGCFVVFEKNKKLIVYDKEKKPRAYTSIVSLDNIPLPLFPVTDTKFLFHTYWSLESDTDVTIGNTEHLESKRADDQLFTKEKFFRLSWNLTAIHNCIRLPGNNNELIFLARSEGKPNQNLYLFRRNSIKPLILIQENVGSYGISKAGDIVCKAVEWPDPHKPNYFYKTLNLKDIPAYRQDMEKDINTYQAIIKGATSLPDVLGILTAEFLFGQSPHTFFSSRGIIDELPKNIRKGVKKDESDREEKRPLAKRKKG